jgi:hypothetical protein
VPRPQDRPAADAAWIAELAGAIGGAGFQYPEEIFLMSGTAKARRAVVAAWAAAFVVFVMGPAMLVGCGGGEDGTTPASGPSGDAASRPAGVTPGGPPESPSPSSSSPPQATAFRYQPLWPFRTEGQAHAWRESNRGGGHQPWHLDADQTALSFSRGYLGFTDVDRVVGHTIGAADAHVMVGYPTEGGRTGTAATIHLVRFGAGPDAPWEVVGTRDADTQFSLSRPAYGAVVSSPISAGGKIAGVDESIRVQVRQPSSAAPLGESCCTPAGGTEGTPWSAEVSYRGATDPVLTVVASTGGHLLQVERFTVTGIRPTSRPSTP